MSWKYKTLSLTKWKFNCYFLVTTANNMKIYVFLVSEQAGCLVERSFLTLSNWARFARISLKPVKNAWILVQFAFFYLRMYMDEWVTYIKKSKDISLNRLWPHFSPTFSPGNSYITIFKLIKSTSPLRQFRPFSWSSYGHPIPIPKII